MQYCGYLSIVLDGSILDVNLLCFSSLGLAR